MHRGYPSTFVVSPPSVNGEQRAGQSERTVRRTFTGLSFFFRGRLATCPCVCHYFALNTAEISPRRLTTPRRLASGVKGKTRHTKRESIFHGNEKHGDAFHQYARLSSFHAALSYFRFVILASTYTKLTSLGFLVRETRYENTIFQYDATIRNIVRFILSRIDRERKYDGTKFKR